MRGAAGDDEPAVTKAFRATYKGRSNRIVDHDASAKTSMEVSTHFPRPLPLVLKTNTVLLGRGAGRAHCAQIGITRAQDSKAAIRGEAWREPVSNAMACPRPTFHAIASQGVPRAAQHPLNPRCTGEWCGQPPGWGVCDVPKLGSTLRIRPGYARHVGLSP